jgi:UDP-N-acetylmuramoyl-tripeptide--D-alanyl-D-alanine ligase
VTSFPPIHLRLVGRHQVANALAAVAVAREYRLDPLRWRSSARASLKQRMESDMRGGATLLVDCYNSNPDSARAALERWRIGRRAAIAVLGDMLELGPPRRAARRSGKGRA